MPEIYSTIPVELETEYHRVLLNSESTLFYQSLKYHRHLCEHLDCESLYLVWQSDDVIKALFPFLIKKDKNYGTIFNSLPYYGSNGGFVFDQDTSAEDRMKIFESFSKTIERLYKENNACLSTIVINPFENEQDAWLNTNLKHDFQDDRIGQITELPDYSNQIEEDLISIFSSPRPRNIRRARKAEITIKKQHDLESLEFLYKVHKDNIESIGGKPKEWSFFECIPKFYDEEDFVIYVAYKDNMPISALLLFFYNKTVEYFTPATIHDFRNDQPSALLILEGMKESASKGFKYWNWGGTWRSQTGVYDFKKRWGATDNAYNYYIRVLNSDITNVPLEELSEAFPYFYLYPFKTINNDAEEN